MENTNESNLQLDSREKTCEPIYEHIRKRELEGDKRQKAIVLLSLFLTFSALILVAVLQYDEYFAYKLKREDYINKTRTFCNLVDIANIDIISTPLAIIIVTLYIIIYKRRVFLIYEYKYRNIGLPMITSCWNKTDRFYTSLTYGMIAFNIFNIVKNSLTSNLNSKRILSFTDPTGLLSLLLKIIEVLFVGIRYYPILTAYRINSFIFCLTSAIYMWIDFTENIYQYGKCESISTEITPSNLYKINERAYIAYKVFSALPLCFFSSFICCSLTYKTAVSLIDFKLKQQKSKPTNSEIDSFCCSLCDINDDHEIIYCEFDFQYVFKLLNKPKVLKCDRKTLLAVDAKMSLDSSSKKWRIFVFKLKLLWELFSEGVKNFSSKYIYEWIPEFRFTSRFVNTIVVAALALYYFFLYWLFTVFKYLTKLPDDFPDNLKIFRMICEVSEELCVKDDFVFENLSNCIDTILDHARQKKNATFDKSGFVNSVYMSAIIPVFVSLFICVFQLFFLVKDSRKHLLDLYKGQCEFVKKSKNLKNGKIAGGSFHFGGFLVGYLIWGYYIIYIFGLFMGILITFMKHYGGDYVFGKIALKLLPIITVIIAKKIINKYTAKYAFLHKESKLLALNNFRAFNVFLYFNFYFDCFMGFISAIIRLLKAGFFAILMMPRRHLEKYDNGYSCYAVHTNPIIVTFCSILYYKDLSDHIHDYRMKKVNSLKIELLYERKMKKQLEEQTREENRTTTPTKRTPATRVYKKIIVNKWHLLLRLYLNKELINYRKEVIENEKKNRELKEMLMKTSVSKLVFDFSEFKKIIKKDFNKINSL